MSAPHPSRPSPSPAAPILAASRVRARPEKARRLASMAVRGDAVRRRGREPRAPLAGRTRRGAARGRRPVVSASGSRRAASVQPPPAESGLSHALQSLGPFPIGRRDVRAASSSTSTRPVFARVDLVRNRAESDPARPRAGDRGLAVGPSTCGSSRPPRAGTRAVAAARHRTGRRSRSLPEPARSPRCAGRSRRGTRGRR